MLPHKLKNLDLVIGMDMFVIQLRNLNWDPRWRPLEAALAGVGSQAKPIEECLEDDEESKQPAPIDIQGFLTNFIPSIIGLFG